MDKGASFGTGTPRNSEEVAKAIGPTLDAFVKQAEAPIRRVVESIYEQLLFNTQDYLRENAEWNLGGEIDRCRRIEADNRDLRKTNAALIEALEFYANGIGFTETQDNGAIAEAAIAKAKGADA